MPPLSRWMVRLALVYCWLGMGLAALLLSNKGRPELFPDTVGGWLLAHVNLLLVGWMVQLSMGVAYWIMPRLPNSLTQRGRVGAMHLAAFLLNIGTGLYVGMTLLAQALPEWRWLQAVGLVCQALAFITFAYHLWPRIRPVFLPLISA